MKLEDRRKKKGVGGRPEAVGAGHVKGAKVTPGNYSLLPVLSKGLGKGAGADSSEIPSAQEACWRQNETRSCRSGPWVTFSLLSSIFSLG